VTIDRVERHIKLVGTLKVGVSLGIEESASEFDAGHNDTLAWLTQRALSAWDLPLAAALGAKLFHSDRRIALKLLGRLPLLSLAKAGRVLKLALTSKENAVAKKFLLSPEMFNP